MLKGKLVLTKDYFGKVLNDAEREPCVIIEVIRQYAMFSPEYRGKIWYEAAVYGWEVVHYTMAVPWREVGKLRFYDSLPKWLYKRALKRWSPKRPRKLSRHR